MNQKSLNSYPTNELELNNSLEKLQFKDLYDLPIDSISSKFGFMSKVSESLWTDIRFFTICQSLDPDYTTKWLVDVRIPNHSNYIKLYNMLPVVFSSDFKSPKEYYQLISQPLGKSTADSIIYVWEYCIVLPNSNKWAFLFDREREQGNFYCQAISDISDGLMPFIEE